MAVKSENKMWAKQHSALCEGCRNNQRSKDVVQETCVKKTLDVSQANLVANNKKEHAVLLRSLKPHCGNARRSDAPCTRANNVQVSAADSTSVLGSQNKNGNSTQVVRNPTSARQLVAMSLGTRANNVNN